MPLAIVHTESSEGWGGQEIRILTEAQGMLANGHRVVLATTPAARIGRAAPAYGLPVLTLPIGRKSLRGVMAMRRLLASERYDIVNTHSSTDSWLAALSCISMRDAPALVRTRHISAPISSGTATRWLYAHAATRVVTTGERLRKDVLEGACADPRRVVSIPTGIDTTRFTPGDRMAARHALGLAPDARLIGIVASLRTWKGHEFLIEAMRAIDEPTLALIVGDGPHRPELERHVASIALGRRVRFTGEQSDVVPWLRALDVFALPSYANEGVPQALLQAMAVGIPCVTTAAGAIPEVARDGITALVVPARDSAALARAIRCLLHDADLGARLASEARRVVLAEHSLPRMLERMESLFEEARLERWTSGRPRSRT